MFIATFIWIQYIKLRDYVVSCVIPAAMHHYYWYYGFYVIKTSTECHYRVMTIIKINLWSRQQCSILYVFVLHLSDVFCILIDKVFNLWIHDSLKFLKSSHYHTPFSFMFMYPFENDENFESLCTFFWMVGGNGGVQHLFIMALKGVVTFCKQLHMKMQHMARGLTWTDTFTSYKRTWK